MVLDRAIQYLKDNFHCKVDLKEKLWTNKLPIYLSKQYDYMEVEINDSIFILIDCSKSKDLNAETYNKHITSIEKTMNRDIKLSFILVFDNISNYLRMRLISFELSFIAIGKQIYIPYLGKIFSERRESRYDIRVSRSTQKMLPSTQALFLELMITQDFNISMEEMADRLNVTKMTVSRGYFELKNLGLVECDSKAKSSKYRFILDRKEIWGRAQDYLINPILKKVYIQSNSLGKEIKEKMIIAGESALAEYTMLSAPKQDEFGVTSRQYALISNRLEEVPMKESDSYVLYIFKHRMPYQAQKLHPLALVLMFKEEIDERIQGEIEFMMKTYLWDQDK